MVNFSLNSGLTEEYLHNPFVFLSWRLDPDNATPDCISASTVAVEIVYSLKLRDRNLLCSLHFWNNHSIINIINMQRFNEPALLGQLHGAVYVLFDEKRLSCLREAQS